MAGKTIKKKLNKEYKGTGRPSVMTAETLDKLKEAYIIGCNNKEACLYADISLSALYAYFRDNPSFKELTDIWRNDTALRARIAARDSILNGDEIMSRWYLERKVKDEFSLSHSVDINATVGALSIDDRAAALKDYINAFKPPVSDSTEK